MEEGRDDVVELGMMGMEELFVEEREELKKVMLKRGEEGVGGVGKREGREKGVNMVFGMGRIEEGRGRELGGRFVWGRSMSK